MDYESDGDREQCVLQEMEQRGIGQGPGEFSVFRTLLRAAYFDPLWHDSCDNSRLLRRCLVLWCKDGAGRGHGI